MKSYKIKRRGYFAGLAIIALFGCAAILFSKFADKGISITANAPQFASNGADPGSETSLKTHKRITQNKPRLLNGPQYQTYDDQGHVNRELIKLAGIQVERASELEAAVSQVRQAVATEMQRRAILVESESDIQTGVATYFVPGSPQSADEFDQQLDHLLSESFGPGASRMLGQYFNKPRYLASFGRYDLKVTFKEQSLQPGGSSGDGSINYIVTEPQTGEVKFKGGFTRPEYYKQAFENLLENEISWGGN